MLQAVFDMHLDVRQQRRRNDNVVTDIMAIIDDMLDEADSRPSAIQLYKRFRRALATARAWFKKEGDGMDDHSFPAPFRTNTDLSMIRAQPPQLPPGEEHRTTFGLGIARPPSQSPNGLGYIGSAGISPIPPPWTGYPSNDRRASSASNSGSIRRSESLSGNSRHNSNGASTLPSVSPPQKHLSWPTPSFLEEDEITPVVNRNGVFSNPSHRPSPISQQQLSSHQRSPSIAQHLHSSTPEQHSPPTPQHPSVESPVGALGSPTTTQNGTANEGLKRDFPKASVDQILKWVADKKINSRVPNPIGYECLHQLHARDQVSSFHFITNLVLIL